MVDKRGDMRSGMLSDRRVVRRLLHMGGFKMSWLGKLFYTKKDAAIDRLEQAQAAFLEERVVAAAAIARECQDRKRAENERDISRQREEALQDVIQKIANSYQPVDIKDELRGQLSVCNEQHFRVFVGVSELDISGPDVTEMGGSMRTDVVKIEGRVGFSTTKYPEMSHNLTLELASLMGEWVREELLRRHGWGV